MKRIITAVVFVACAALTATCTPPSTSTAGTVTWGSPLPHAKGHYPTIVVENDTSPGWPVGAAVKSWDVPVAFGSCVTGVTCVRFTEVTTLGGNRVGLTTVPATAPAVITIQLADNPTMTALQTRQDVAHEFGHALGLGHDDIGVMHAEITGAFIAPNAAELARVRSLYLS